MFFMAETNNELRDERVTNAHKATAGPQTEDGATAKRPLLGLTLAELKRVAAEVGLPAFAGKQMAEWLYKHRVKTIAEMTNLSKAGRERLAAAYEVGCSAHLERYASVDGTVKYLFPAGVTGRGGCGFVESVFIPDGERATLCVSSQVGCKMACAFCMTGRQGFEASLSATGILNQIFSLPESERLTNVVFMGQGEPFDNLDAVLRATEVLTAPWGCGWSPKRITVSSVGLAKGLRRFVDESQCHLAISLHNPFPEERAQLMPAERAFSIREVVRLLEQYDVFRKQRGAVSDNGQSHQRRVSFEYIVFKGLNDSRRHADELLRLLRNLDCRINLIRFHHIPDTPLHGLDDEGMKAFRDYLTQHGLFTTIRASRGQDIWAACGLLSTAKREEQAH